MTADLFLAYAASSGETPRRVSHILSLPMKRSAHFMIMSRSSGSGFKGAEGSV